MSISPITAKEAEYHSSLRATGKAPNNTGPEADIMRGKGEEPLRSHESRRDSASPEQPREAETSGPASTCNTMPSPHPDFLRLTAMLRASAAANSQASFLPPRPLARAARRLNPAAPVFEMRVAPTGQQAQAMKQQLGDNFVQYCNLQNELLQEGDFQAQQDEIQKRIDDIVGAALVYGYRTA